MNLTHTIFDVSNSGNQTENFMFMLTFILSVLTPSGYIGWKCFRNSSCQTQSKCSGGELEIQIDKNGKIDIDLEIGKKEPKEPKEPEEELVGASAVAVAEKD